MTQKPLPQFDHHLVARHKWLTLWQGFNHQPYVVSNDGIFVIPLNYAGEIMFIREPDIPHANSVLTLPGGSVDLGEDPSESANRELQEEIGYKATQLDFLGTIKPLGRHSIWFIHLFLAQGLMPSEKVGDEIYDIAIERVAFDRFESLIATGQLKDANIITALYLARGFLRGDYRPSTSRAVNEFENARYARYHPARFEVDDAD
jgi:ADP-ribose diphosphatase